MVAEVAAVVSRRCSGAACLATSVAVVGAIVVRAAGVDLAVASEAAEVLVVAAAVVDLAEVLVVAVTSEAEVPAAAGNADDADWVNQI